MNGHAKRLIEAAAKKRAEETGFISQEDRARESADLKRRLIAEEITERDLRDYLAEPSPFAPK